MMSRAAAGTVGRKAIFVLPGSPNAVKLAMIATGERRKLQARSESQARRRAERKVANRVTGIR